MTITLIVMFGLLGIGMVLVIHGTIAKNRWGINVGPVSCPRCNAPLPQIRQPQNIRQALWGGGTCTKCGVEVDKWGRELVSQRYPSAPASVQPEGEMRRVLKRRLIIFTAAGFFCLTMLFDWLGMGDHPSTLGRWTVFVGTGAVETTIFTVLFYFASMSLLDRFFLGRKGNGNAWYGYFGIRR